MKPARSHVAPTRKSPGKAKSSPRSEAGRTERASRLAPTTRTLQEAAAFLNLAPLTIARWIRSGRVEVSGSVDEHGNLALSSEDVAEIARHELYASLGGVFRELNRISRVERVALADGLSRSL